MDDFKALVNGGRRVLYIYRDPAAPPAEFAHRLDLVRGWCFVVEDVDAAGSASPVWDTWEDSFDQIIQYPQEYCADRIVWRDRLSGEVVDLDPLSNTYR